MPLAGPPPDCIEVSVRSLPAVRVQLRLTPLGRWLSWGMLNLLDTSRRIEGKRTSTCTNLPKARAR